MADLTITAANVAPGSGAVQKTAIAGGSITAGQSLQMNSSGYLVGAKGDSQTDANCVGVALCNAASGQPVVYQSSGPLTIGATVVPGMVYVVSAANAGGIAPISDMTSGNYETILGYASSTTVIQLDIIPTGIAHG